MRCSKCDFENQEEMDFCGKCGAGLVATLDIAAEVKCNKCGAMMPAGAMFCGICGFELSESSPALPSTTPREPVVVADPAENPMADSTEEAASISDPAKTLPVDQPAAETVSQSPSGSLREMAVVPAGWFAMGSPSAVGNDDERPRHQVHLSSFYIDCCAVSNLDYERFDANHRRLRPEVADHDNAPVVFVSHADCLNYCRWRAEQEGLPPDAYSLPTEAQWERAARGKSLDNLYPWGDKIGPDQCNTFECGRGRVVPIAEGAANEFGLFHLGSNVREWCLDFYSAKYYRSADAAGADPAGPRKGLLVSLNVVRGASFQTKATEWGRCSARNYAHPNSASSDIGFRCVRANR